jgi:curved DNA-binding protein
MPATFRDYYQTLGVTRTAGADEIKKAFRKLARQHHPDVAKDKKAGEIKFKEINEAYEVLSDPAKRKKYDELGEHWNAQGGPPPGYEYARGAGPAGAQDFHFEGTGFSDFFEQFFGAGGNGGGRSFGGFSTGSSTRGARRGGPLPGQDVEGDISVTLEEAMRGAIREISLQSTDPATGQRKVETFKVRIPKGALEGQVIRVPGKGGPGSGGGEPGHLFLRVRLASHPEFRASGADLYHDLPLAPWEAVLGTTVRVPGLDGEVDLKIPPGTNNGQHLRLRGRGLPKPRSTERGDLYVVAEVEFPKQVSPEEKQLWEQLSRASSFHPRG